MNKDEVFNKLSPSEQEFLSDYQKRLCETEKQLQKIKGRSITSVHEQPSVTTSLRESKQQNRSPATRLSPVVFNQTNRPAELLLPDTSDTIQKERMQQIIDQELKEREFLVNRLKDELSDEPLSGYQQQLSLRPTLGLNSISSIDEKDEKMFRRKDSPDAELEMAGYDKRAKTNAGFYQVEPAPKREMESIGYQGEFRKQLDAKYKEVVEKKRGTTASGANERIKARGKSAQKVNNKREGRAKRCAKLGKGGIKRLLELVTDHMQDCPNFAAALEREGFL